MLYLLFPVSTHHPSVGVVVSSVMHLYKTTWTKLNKKPKPLDKRPIILPQTVIMHRGENWTLACLKKVVSLFLSPISDTEFSTNKRGESE